MRQSFPPIPRHLKLSAAALTALLLVLAVGQAMHRHLQAQSGFRQPTDLGLKAFPFHRCYPSTYQPPHLVRQVTLGPASYYEIQASSRDPQTRTPTTLHIRTQGSACAWLNRQKPTHRLSYLPQPVAVSFALAQYQPLLQRCLQVAQQLRVANPQTHCQQEMERGLSGTPQQPQPLFPEELIALAQLGLNPNRLQHIQRLP